MVHVSAYATVNVAGALSSTRIAYSNPASVWELGTIGENDLVERPTGVVLTSGSLAALRVTTNAIGATFEWKKNGVAATETVLGVYSGGRQVGSTLYTSTEGQYSVTVKSPGKPDETVMVGVRSWASLAGNYQALLENVPVSGGSVASDSSTDQRYPGRVTLTLTSTGSFTGKLDYEGQTYSLVGVFDGSTLTAVTSIGRAGGALPVRLELKFTGSDLANRTITASTSAALPANGAFGVDWLEQSVLSPARLEASGTMLRGGSSASATNAPGATPAFAALLQDAAASPARANGIISLTVSSAGLVTIAAVLGDGADAISTTTSAYLTSGGTVAFYRGLYGTTHPNSGFVAGRMKLDWNAGNAVDLVSSGSELEWKRPPSASGLTAKLKPLGSRYDSSVSVFSVLGVTSGLTLGMYQPAKSTQTGVEARFGLTNLSLKAGWTLDSSWPGQSFVSGAEGGDIRLGSASTLTSMGTPTVVLKVGDVATSKFYQCSGVILQQPPAGVAPGMYGVLPFVKKGTSAVVWTEWTLR
jgi:hypothetical protein